MTGIRSDVRGRVDVGAGSHHQQQYQCPPHSSHQHSSVAPHYHRTTNTSPILGQQPQLPFNGKKSFWRRIFCLCMCLCLPTLGVSRPNSFACSSTRMMVTLYSSVITRYWYNKYYTIGRLARLLVPLPLFLARLTTALGGVPR